MSRILILSTTFFPDPHVGAVRITQFCHHLPEFGWQPTVYTKHYGYTATSEMIATHVHPQVQLHYLNEPEMACKANVATHPFRMRLRRFLAEMVGMAVIPDSSVLFWRSVQKRLLREIQEQKPDVILTTSPSHGVHICGMYLSQKARIPWVADFRDVYLIDFKWGYGGLQRLNWLRHSRFDRLIYQRAALVLHAIPLHARWAARRYGFAKDRIITIENGCPNILIDGVSPPEVSKERYVISVVGCIDDKDVEYLARSIQMLIKRGYDPEFRIVGEIPHCADHIKDMLKERVVMTGLIKHSDALKEIASADVLVSYLCERRSKGYQLTSKLFEFLGSGKPTIEINPTVPDIQFLKKWPMAHILHHPPIEQIADCIQSAIEKKIQSPGAISQFQAIYNRRSQVKRLATLLNSLSSSMTKGM
jgi:glycosyltransferase involved in cell wall biosynthesis